MLAETLIVWLDKAVIPLLVALTVAIPATMSAVRARKDNATQHDEGRDLLHSLDAKVTALDAKVTALDAKVGDLTTPKSSQLNPTVFGRTSYW